LQQQIAANCAYDQIERGALRTGACRDRGSVRKVRQVASGGLGRQRKESAR